MKDNLKFNASIQPGAGVSVMKIQKEMVQGNLSSISGNESLDTIKTTMANLAGFESINGNSNVARTIQNISTRDTADYDNFKTQMVGDSSLQSELEKYVGAEGFSLQNKPGDVKKLKAINLALNAQSNIQTSGAEALFRTIVIPYETETVDLTVRAAGLGKYVSGASAYQRASELRPLFGLLRTGDIFRDDALRVYPVFPADTGDSLRTKFVDPAKKAPVAITYTQGDAYGREGHNTQMLKVPFTIDNLLALCTAPGQRAWTSTDQIEASAIQVNNILIEGNFNGTAVEFFVNTNTMSNNTFGVTTNGQSSDDRALNLVGKSLPGFSVQDKNGTVVGETLFAALAALNYEPVLNFSLKGDFQRQTNETAISSGSVTISGVRAIGGKGPVIPTHEIAEAEVKALVIGFQGAVTGATPQLNLDNISQSNFGYRIEVYDATKKLATRRRTPISVKYPVRSEDVNQESLDFAVEQMSIAINNQCSADAFKLTEQHFQYIKGIDGSGVVANQQGSNILPGQFYVTASAIDREVTLQNSVSVANNEDLFLAIAAVLINEVSDMVAALNTKSGLASIREYGAINDTKYSLVVHQNLARFFQRVGDIRVIGGWEQVKVEATNFDSMIGKMYLVPADETAGDTINPLAGVGINVAKENVVVEGNMHRDSQHFGVIMTIPSYRHHPLCPVIGRLTVTDAAELLTDEGLIHDLAKLRLAAANQETGFKVDTGEGEVVDPNA